MDNVFPNATEARDGARNNSLIYGEIRAIEAAVLTAIDKGLLGVTVPGVLPDTTVIAGTTMTGTDATGQSYCAVWQGAVDRSKFEQMMIVLKYFGDLGYTIRRKLNVNVQGGPSSTATVTNGDASNPEIQTITPGTLTPNAAYSLTIGGVTLTTPALSPSPTILELVPRLQATSGYATAPFTIAANGSNIVLTWKTVGDVTGVAMLSSTISTTSMQWELLW